MSRAVTLADAEQIVEATLEHARTVGVEDPLTVAVLDAGGHVILLKRQDGSGFMKPDVAIAKAWCGLGMERSSRALGERAEENPTFITSIAALAGGRMLPVPGGVRIMDAERPVGAVGVSGTSSDVDEECAIMGIRAAAFGTDPEQPHPQ